MSKSRKPWLDIIRATAILCVVLCHSVEAFYRPVLLGQLRLSFPFWNIENLLYGRPNRCSTISGYYRCTYAAPGLSGCFCFLQKITVSIIPYYRDMALFQLHFLLSDRAQNI